MTTSRHLRPGRGGIAWLGLFIGIGLGVALGLFYTWEIDPVIERNTAPWQLSESAREDYVVAVALSYAQNRDLPLAFNRLRALRPDRNVWQLVADIACERVKTGKAVSNADIRVIRALEQLYRPQGASGCADGLYPTPAPVVFSTPIPTYTLTPSLEPPPTKTPTPPAFDTPEPVLLPTVPAETGGRYELARLRSFCDPALDGVIEVRVYDRLGKGIPGVPVTVTWGGAESDRFFTGLQPERGSEYADFKMTPGRTYTIVVPGLIGTPPVVEAAPCQTVVDGKSVFATMSYWVNFQQRAN